MHHQQAHSIHYNHSTDIITSSSNPSSNHLLQGHQPQQQHENSKSISWCKKRTLYQSGIRGSYGLSPQGFSSYFEGCLPLEQQQQAGGEEEEEDLNTVLQSYLESTSFSEAQSSCSPSQQSTDSGFAGDAGYATPSSNVSYYAPQTPLNSGPSLPYVNTSTSNSGSGNTASAHAAAYNSNSTTTNNNGFYPEAAQQQQQSQHQQSQQFYSDYEMSPFLEPSFVEGSYDFGHPTDTHLSPEDDFHSSEDLSVIVDQVLSSIDEAQFEASELGADEVSGLLQEEENGEEVLENCDNNNIMNNNNSRRNVMPLQQLIHHQHPYKEECKEVPESCPAPCNDNNSQKSNEGRLKSVAAVQPMQRSVGVVEPRVIVKIPVNKIRDSSGEENTAQDKEVMEEVEEDNQNGGKEDEESDLEKLKKAAKVEEEEDDDRPPQLIAASSPGPPPLKEESVIESNKKESIVKREDVLPICVDPPRDDEILPLLQAVSHGHHKKKKHKRKKKKLCKCGGSKKRKRCETPTQHGGTYKPHSTNPLKIIRVSQEEEGSEFSVYPMEEDAPVLERQDDLDSFGTHVNASSLLSFRDLALKAAAAAEDNVMYSNEEDEGQEPLTPPPPTLHRHDSPEPTEKEQQSHTRMQEEEENKEELVDLLAADMPLPKVPEKMPEIKKEVITPPPQPSPQQQVAVPSNMQSFKAAQRTLKMVLEKDPEDEWLYCSTKHCQFWTRKPSRMERHRKTHAGTEEDMYYVCPDCFAKFYSLAKMLKHDRKFHTGEKDYECKICEAEVTDIHVHMRVHRADKEFRCSSCPLTFRHKNSLVRHVFQHSGERPYKCQTCNSGFFSLSKLKEHVRRRHNPEPIKTEARTYPKLAPRLSAGGDDDVVIVGLKPAPAAQLSLPGGTGRTILTGTPTASSIILPPAPQPAQTGVLSYLAQGPNGSVYLVTNPAPGTNIFMGGEGGGIILPQQPLFIPQSPVLFPQQQQTTQQQATSSPANNRTAGYIQSNPNSSALFVLPAAPLLNVPPTCTPSKPPQEKKLDILQQAILEIPDHFQSFEEE